MAETRQALADRLSIDTEQAGAVLDMLKAHERIVAREIEAERAEATRHALDLGVSPTLLARAAEVTRATVYRWEADYGE